MEKKLKYRPSLNRVVLPSKDITHSKYPNLFQVKMSSTPVSMDTILLSLKTLESADLFKFMKAALSEAEKKSKQSKTASPSSTKKAGSMPKGAVPPQLKKPRAWVEYTLKDALENGWDTFTIVQKKKDKEANTTIEEEIEMPASVLHDGSHIYKDSISEKNPNGRPIIHKEAMSLSKHRKETGHSSYAEFEAQYVDEPVSSDEDSKSESASTTSSKKIVIKKTAAEKEAEKEAKKAAKEEEKEAKKAEKEAEKEAKKAAKDAEKAEKKSADAVPSKAVKKPAAK
jgi:hypothetical protein